MCDVCMCMCRSFSSSSFFHKSVSSVFCVLGFFSFLFAWMSMCLCIQVDLWSFVSMDKKKRRK